MLGPNKSKTRLLAFFTASFLGFFSAMQLSGWHLMKLFGAWGGGRFLDTKQVLHWVDCYESIGNTIYSGSGECSGYIYGSSLISIARFLGIHEYHLMQVGFLLLLLLSLSLAWILDTASRKRNRKFAGLILLSPPILLLAERGNVDVLMLFLLVVSSWAFQNKKEVIGILLLALACILKFYLFPIFFVYFVYCSKKWTKVFLTGVAILVLARIILDLKLIESSFPQIWGAQFGMSVWLRYAEKVGYYPSEILIQGFGLFLFVILCVIVKKFYSTEPYKSVGTSQKDFYFVVFFGVHLTCFLLGMSFDYRLVFLLASALFFMEQVSENSKPNVKIFRILTLLSAWLVYQSWVLQVIGDLATELLTSILLFPFIKILFTKARLQK
jgi:hypothetical protein